MPTIKQKKAIENVVGNGGNVTQAMRDAGYSENTINTPQKLTESKAWLELVDKGLPDDMLLEVHREGLQATKRSGTGGMKVGIGTDGKVNDFGHTEIDEPDYPTRHKYLDTAYKLKGSYAPEKSLTLNLNVDTTMTQKEKALVEEFDEKLKKESLE